MTRLAEWMQARVSWSRGAEGRGRRALRMLAVPDQITRVSPGHYSAASQSQPGLWYDVRLAPSGRWGCTCPDHEYRKAQCKHVLAVTAEVVDREAAAVADAGAAEEEAGAAAGEEDSAAPDGLIHVHPVDEEVPPKCRHCPGTRIIRYGNQYWTGGGSGGAKSRQRYQCRTCGRVFVYRAGMERMRCGMGDVTGILNDYFKGHTLESVRDTLGQDGPGMSGQNAHRIIKKYVRIVDAYTSGLRLGCLGDRFHADELEQKIRGEDCYNFGIMDSKTRYMLASQVADRKDGFSATGLLRAAALRAGKMPAEFVSDDLGSYKVAFRAVYAPRNPADMHCAHLADPDKANVSTPPAGSGGGSPASPEHIDKAGISKHDHYNNNVFERFNGTQRACYRPRRGIKSAQSPVFSGFRVWYNFMRSHSAIKRTPAEAAGIVVHGPNKWRTLIGNASMAAPGGAAT